VWLFTTYSSIPGSWAKIASDARHAAPDSGPGDHSHRSRWRRPRCRKIQPASQPAGQGDDGFAANLVNPDLPHAG
jgi:hypothetical protein